MAPRPDPPVSRQRGSIRRRARCYEARVSAGEDPSIGERIVLVDSVTIEGQGERADRAAYREVEKLRTKLLSDADELKVARTKATVGALLERWVQQHEIDPTTRMTYESQIRMYIVPAVADVPLVLFVRDASQRLEPSTAASGSAERCATAGRSSSSTPRRVGTTARPRGASATCVAAGQRGT